MSLSSGFAASRNKLIELAQRYRNEVLSDAEREMLATPRAHIFGATAVQSNVIISLLNKNPCLSWDFTTSQRAKEFVEAVHEELYRGKDAA